MFDVGTVLSLDDCPSEAPTVDEVLVLTPEALLPVLLFDGDDGGFEDGIWGVDEIPAPPPPALAL